MAEHRSIIGTYEDRSTADAVANDLGASGFSSRNIEILNGATGSPDGAGLRQRLMSWGLPAGDAEHYVDAANAGRALVVVDARDNQVDEAVRIMRRDETLAGEAVDTGIRGEEELEATVPVVEEELHVGKERVVTGGVRVVHRSTERPVHEDVTLRDERVHVERHAADRPATAADTDRLRSADIELSESEERAVVGKSARVVEEVEISKEAREHTERIDETVRRDDIDVEKIPGEKRPDAHP